MSAATVRFWHEPSRSTARAPRRLRAEGALHVRRRSSTSSSSGSGRACGRSRAARRSSPSPATSSSTRSATSRSSSCATRRRRDRARSTTPACTAAPASPTGAGAFADGAHPVPLPRVALRARRPARATSSTATSSPTARRPAPRGRCASSAGAGSCSSTSTPTPSRCSTSSIRCPTLLAPYRLDEMRFRALPHDDHRRELEGGRRRVQRELPRAGHCTRRSCRGPTTRASPTSSSARTRTTAGCRTRAASCGRARASASRPDESTRARSSPALVAGLGGAFLGEERARSTSCARRARRPATLLGAYQERRMKLLADARLRRVGLHARPDDERRRRVLVPERRRPDLPGQRAPVPRPAERPRPRLARSRTRGCSSGRARATTWQMPERRFYADWHERNWGEITEQDYDEPRQRADAACTRAASTGSRLNPRRRATSCTCTASSTAT